MSTSSHDFSGQKDVGEMIDAALIYARTGKLAPLNIQSALVSDPQAAIEMAVSSVGTKSKIYEARGRNYGNYAQSKALVDIIAVNVQKHSPTVHPDCVSTKNPGSGMAR